MKKMLSILLALSMILSAAAALAETAAEETEAPAFDKSAIEDSPYYTYDRFSRKWELSSQWSMQQGNSLFQFKVRLDSDTVEQSSNMVFFAWAVYNGTRYPVTSLDAVVEDTIYHFNSFRDNGSASYTLCGGVMREFLNDIAPGKYVAFRFGFTSNGQNLQATIEENNVEANLADIMGLAALLESSGAWSISHDDPAMVDIVMEASKE